MRFDTTLKEIFQTPPQRLLTILVGQEATELLTVEYPSVKKRLPDLVARLKDGSLFHLELQSHMEADMNWRMLEYYLLIRRQYPQAPLHQLVLFVGRDKPTFETNIAEKMLQFRYDLKDIRYVDCQMMLTSPRIEENLLAILCHLKNPQGTVREILTRIARLSPKVRADQLERLMILAGLRKLETVVQKEVKEMPISIELMDNDFWRDAFLKGEAEGKIKGVQEGRQEGRQEGAASVFVRQVEYRFGPLPNEIQELIDRADKATLEEWSLQVLEAKSLADLFDRVGIKKE
ncbi:MAG: DUF4351 domain-containing protein [Magnetococcales bacterium]|nr:DUF4351 domain-containing protein [Magnetococcales bacterium]